LVLNLKRAMGQAIVLAVFFAVRLNATVLIHSPSNEVTVGTSVDFVASASTITCSKGIKSMGIYLDSKLIYKVAGNALSTTVAVKPGKHKTEVKEWDHCGGSSSITRKIVATTQVGVNMAAPLSNSFVSSPVNFVATGTTDCANGISGMGVYVDNQLVFASSGPSLNTQLNLSPGIQSAEIQEWDNCGGSSTMPLEFIVEGAPGTGTVLSNIQAATGWKGYAEYPPAYDICSTNCPGIYWSMEQNTASPSLSGNATEFDMGGVPPNSVAYSDILWTNPVLGQFSSQGIPDTNHTLLPTLHNFTYDADFFVTNLPVTQVLEFDISMYMGPVGMIWGTQCNNLGDQSWDIWNNASGYWFSTGVPCNPINNAWNHITIQAQREPDNTLLYESITLNGSTAILNTTEAPFTVPASWWGVTMNYQMDGNKKMSPNTTYLDNLTLTFW
jgi:hypothetical protein